MSKKTIAFILAVIMVCVGAIGGTLAWLSASKEATGTFTVGDIDIELNEKELNADQGKLIPGTEIAMQPTITVKADSEDCYMFAMVENNLKGNGKTIGAINVSSDWQAVATQGNKTIYKYKNTGIVSKSNQDTQLTSIFTHVAINGDEVTKQDLENLENNTIEIKAYAHQKTAQEYNDAFAAAKAHFGGNWTNINA